MSLIFKLQTALGRLFSKGYFFNDGWYDFLAHYLPSQATSGHSKVNKKNPFTTLSLILFLSNQSSARVAIQSFFIKRKDTRSHFFKRKVFFKSFTRFTNK